MTKRGLPDDLFFGEREAALKVVFLSLLALLLRYLQYDLQPLWTDEVITWEFARADWNGLLLRQLYDASPPGSYLLLKWWLTFARSDTEMRLLSVLLGALTVPAAYCLGMRTLGKRAGLWAALLVAVNPLHLYYSVEVRYPALLTLLATLQLWFFAEMARRARWLWCVLWSTATAAALWVQYFTVFFIAAQIGYLLIFQRRSKRLWPRLAVCLTAVALAFLPWVPEFLLQLSAGKPSREFFGLLQQLFLSPVFLALGGSEWSLPLLFGIPPSAMVYPLVALGLAAPAGLAVWLGMKTEREATLRRLLAFQVLGVAMLFFIAAQVLPLFRPKYLLPLLPPLAVLAGAGLTDLQQRRRWLGWALGLIVLAVSLRGVLLNPADPLLQKEPWREAAETILHHAEPGDVIAVPNDYYSLALWFALGDRWPIEAVVGRTPYEQVAAREVVAGNVQRLFARYRRIWYIDHDRRLFDPDGLAPKLLAAAGREVTRLSFPKSSHFSTRLFARDDETARESLAPVVDFRTEDYLPEQLMEGLLPGPSGFRWLGAAAEVRVARRWREDTAFACFYVHVPYFRHGPPTFTLSADRVIVRTLKVANSQLVCLEGMLAPASADRRETVLRLTVDAPFIPDEVLGDGDQQPKSVLLQRLGVSRSGSAWELP